MTVSESLWGCLLQADEWRTIEFLISVILSLASEVQLGFFAEFYAMALADLKFFLGKMGDKTKDCERDEELGSGRIDRVSHI